MNEPLEGEALKVLAELAVLRMLVETVITCLPAEVQREAMAGFQQQCEECAAQLLGSTGRDLLLEAMDRAMKLQLHRLRGAGLPLPPG